MSEKNIAPSFIKKVESEDKSVSGTVNLYSPPVKTNFISGDYQSSYYLVIGEIIFRTEDKKEEPKWEKFVELISIKKTARHGSSTYENDLVVDFSTATEKAVESLKKKMGLTE